MKFKQRTIYLAVFWLLLLEAAISNKSHQIFCKEFNPLLCFKNQSLPFPNHQRTRNVLQRLRQNESEKQQKGLLQLFSWKSNHTLKNSWENWGYSNQDLVNDFNGKQIYHKHNRISYQQKCKSRERNHIQDRDQGVFPELRTTSTTGTVSNNLNFSEHTVGVWNVGNYSAQSKYKCTDKSLNKILCKHPFAYTDLLKKKLIFSANFQKAVFCGTTTFFGAYVLPKKNASKQFLYFAQQFEILGIKTSQCSKNSFINGKPESKLRHPLKYNYNSFPSALTHLKRKYPLHSHNKHPKQILKSRIRRMPIKRVTLKPFSILLQSQKRQFIRNTLQTRKAINPSQYQKPITFRPREILSKNEIKITPKIIIKPLSKSSKSHRFKMTIKPELKAPKIQFKNKEKCIPHPPSKSQSDSSDLENRVHTLQHKTRGTTCPVSEKVTASSIQLPKTLFVITARSKSHKPNFAITKSSRRTVTLTGVDLYHRSLQCMPPISDDDADSNLRGQSNIDRSQLSSIVLKPTISYHKPFPNQHMYSKKSLTSHTSLTNITSTKSPNRQTSKLNGSTLLKRSEMESSNLGAKSNKLQLEADQSNDSIKVTASYVANIGEKFSPKEKNDMCDDGNNIKEKSIIRVRQLISSKRNVALKRRPIAYRQRVRPRPRQGVPAVPGLAGLPGIVAGLPGAVAGLPGMVAGLPARLPGIVAGLPGVVAGLPGVVAGLPARLPGIVAGLPGLAAGLPGLAAGLPGMAAGLLGGGLPPLSARLFDFFCELPRLCRERCHAYCIQLEPGESPPRFHHAQLQQGRQPIQTRMFDFKQPQFPYSPTGLFPLPKGWRYPNKTANATAFDYSSSNNSYCLFNPPPMPWYPWDKERTNPWSEKNQLHMARPAPRKSHSLLNKSSLQLGNDMREVRYHQIHIPDQCPPNVCCRNPWRLQPPVYVANTFRPAIPFTGCPPKFPSFCRSGGAYRVWRPPVVYAPRRPLLPPVTGGPQSCYPESCPLVLRPFIDNLPKTEVPFQDCHQVYQPPIQCPTPLRPCVRPCFKPFASGSC